MRKIVKLSLFILSLLTASYVTAQPRACISDNILCPAPPLVGLAPAVAMLPELPIRPYCKPAMPYHTPKISLQSFDSIETRGDMEIEIQVDNKKPHLQANADLRILRTLNAKVYGNTLVITREDKVNLRDCPRPHIIIHTNYLHRLIHLGNGDVHINGPANLEDLTLNGAGNIQIMRLNTHVFNLHAVGAGTITLAGSVYRLNADVGGMHLDALRLHTCIGFIHTMQTGRADVCVIDSLNAFAQDHSTIYYYIKPKYIYVALLGASSVLNMSHMYDSDYIKA